MQLTRSDILEKLKDILIDAEVVNADKIVNCTESTNIVEDLGFTSVGVLYLVIAIEETFGIRFDNISFHDFKTVGAVVDYIERKLQ